jgi:hypothetical protein
MKVQRVKAAAILLFVFSVVAILTVDREARAKEQTAGNRESAGIGSVETRPREGFAYNEEAGLQYVRDDFTWTAWGYAERVFSDERDYWRRVRQGMEFQFPRFKGEILGNQYRSTFVYEVDFTDNDFFRESKKLKIWENLYATFQDAEDPSRFRFLVGENTHILSREDNLSSGNLTTINRSLILEEHGTVNNFGTQFGTQLQVSTSPHTLYQFSLQDNTGSLNTDDPHYNISNDFTAKMTHIFIENAPRKEKLDFGLALDYTRDVGDKDFTLLSAINQTPLGSVRAAGGKFTVDANADYMSLVFGRPCLIELETMYSHFADSSLNAAGGYLQGQYSIFDSEVFGELVPFVRYDLVHVSVDEHATQQAVRAGINFNLPFTRKHVNLHVEYARNTLSGSNRIVTGERDFNEFAIMLRVSTTPYIRF